MLAVVVTPVALVPAAVLVVVDHELVHDGHGRRDDHDLRGLVRGPGLSETLRIGPQRHRLTQRVTARAPHPRHAPVVHEDGRPGLEHRLVGGGLAVPVAVVGDPGVHPQLDRGERPQVPGDGRRLEAERRGESGVLRRLPRQHLDLLLDVAAGYVLRAPVEARRGPGDAPRDRAPGGGSRGRRQALRRRALRRRCGLLGGGGLGEGVRSGRGGGLQEHLLARGGGSAAAGRPGQHDG